MNDLQERVLPALLGGAAGSRLDEPGVGDQVGPYRIDGLLGRGGMGVVFRGWDERLARPVALKFLSGVAVRHPEGVERLLKEARITAGLDHPSVASVYGFDETREGRPYLVMACYEGETLAQRLRRGTLGMDRALHVARQVADALSAAHAAGVVHRDLKPSNVMVLRNRRVKVLDFGIAHHVGASDEDRAGTLPYMSPEQLRGGEVDYRTDLWSLGVVLYEMLTGKRPFTGRDRGEVVRAVLDGRPVPVSTLRPEVPLVVIEVLGRCLRPDRNDRVSSAAELLSALIECETEWPHRGVPHALSSGAGDAAAEYHKGRRLLEKGDPESVRGARDRFLTALDVDPSHAPSWSGLSDAYEMLAYVAALPPDEAHLRARAAAERSLELDGDLAEAHVSLATVLVDYYRDWDTAERHYGRALELDPSYPVGYQLYAEFLRDRGRFDEALEAIDRAIALDPLSPYHRLVRGIILHMARRDQEAERQFRALLQAQSEYPMAHFFMGMALGTAGRFEEALAHLERMDPDGIFPDAIAVRGVFQALAGRRALAEAALEALTGYGNEAYHVLPFHEALVRLHLGQMDVALDLLEEDADRRSWFSRILGVTPLVDPLRGHPRFEALRKRVGGRKG